MKTAIKIFLPLAALVTLSATADAGNVKFYPATMCQGQGQGSATSALNYYQHGTVHNNSTTVDMPVVCPIVRDEVRADGNGWASLSVNTLNLSTSVWLWCDARSYYPNDYGYATITKRYQAPNTDWTDMDLGTLAAPNPGYLLITCSIPRQVGSYPSGIASYRIDE
jgi:hypothetical protein